MPPLIFILMVPRQVIVKDRVVSRVSRVMGPRGRNYIQGLSSLASRWHHCRSVIQKDPPAELSLDCKADMLRNPMYVTVEQV